jgi:hypothetical protein
MIEQESNDDRVVDGQIVLGVVQRVVHESKSPAAEQDRDG